MNNFYHIAGRLIDYYRKQKQTEFGNNYNVKQFCIENGRNICSFPTYKKIASGQNVNNEGFYYILSNKLGVQFESFDQSNERFFDEFIDHYCEVYRSNNDKQIQYFCDYYESYLKNQKEFLVFRELWACLSLLKGTTSICQEYYLDAMEHVIFHDEFIQCIQCMRTNLEKDKK